MKNYLKLLLLILLIGAISCRSSKDLIYLKDATNDKIIHGTANEYLLKSGDILYVSIKSINPEVNVLFNPESNMETDGMGQGYTKYSTPSGAYLYGFELDSEGYINLPMLGKILVSDISLSQVQSVVQKRADEFLKDAIVKVKLLNYKITIAGEVRNPGVYYNYNNSITVLEALAMASGNTDFASIKKVMIVRSTPQGERIHIC